MNNWKTINNLEIDLYKELEQYLDKDNIIIHVGSDAQANGKNIADFVTVVCIHTIGKGGRVFYIKDKKVPYYSLWEKLFLETNKSLEVAVDLTKTFGHDISERILVHVDANPNTKFESSKHVKALAGMVMGYGYKHVLKPNSWASSHGADRIVKGKN